MIRARKSQESHGGSERWLVTYADLITLLLIFFIVMYSLGQLDLERFKYLSQSLSQAMGGGGMILMNGGPSTSAGQSGSRPPMLEKDQQDLMTLSDIKEQLTDYMDRSGLQSKVSVSSEDRGIVISFQEEVLFVIGSSELTQQAREIIGQVAPILRKVPNYIRVEGHTCNLPIHSTIYPSNWELSSARATTVVKELINKHSFPPQRLSASAYGEYRPRVPNDNEAHRQMNRRVDIVILRNEYQVSEPGSSTK
ncbi:MAG: OmpA/MotB domain protein [Desulfotomaculum sp. 46_296]|nr:MAG: OmpA/MotB domain protein [Desulfotomaculum sp. 46_296]KUK84315.1 MAG: OmpA/MotB domain protein [Desulfofundulus kuznetsovii]HAU32302.1 chemotaxis protein MotB [Desulfotomaculum sp.]